MNIQIQKEEIEGAMVEARRIRRGVRAMAEAIRLEVRRRREVAAMVRALGDALGLILDRQEREPVRQAEQARAWKLARLDRHRIQTLNDGQALAPLTDDQVKALKAADDIEAAARAVLVVEMVEVEPGRFVKGKPKASAAARKAARGKLGEANTLRAGVERDRAAALTGRQDDLRLSEAAALDALREDDEPGALIERRRGQKDVRLRARDGLKMLHERGAFAPRDDQGEVQTGQAARIKADRRLAVGLRFRDRYEMAQSSLGSCLAGSDGVAKKRTVHEAAVLAHAQAARARNLREWEAMVVRAHGVMALDVLRKVAGEARSITSLSASTVQRARLTALLIAALDTIGDKLSKAG